MAEVLGSDKMAQGPNIKRHLKRILDWLWGHSTFNNLVEENKQQRHWRQRWEKAKEEKCFNWE